MLVRVRPMVRQRQLFSLNKGFFSLLRSSQISLNKNIQSLPLRKISFLQNSQHLTQQQVLIQQSAFQFAQQQLLPNAGQWDQKKHFPVDVIKKSAQLGLSAVYVKQQYGGTGLGRLQSSLIFQALSTGCVSTAAYISIHNMCAWIIDSFGSEHQKKNWLNPMTRFDLFSSYCLTQPNSGSDAIAMQTTAKKDGDSYILNGSKSFISGGGVSDLYLVMCRTGQNQISCIGVQKGTVGLSYGKQEIKLGWNSQPTSMVMFEDCKVPKQNLIGKQGQGFKIAMKGLDGGRINIASCSLGGAAFANQQTVKYMKSRKQFGKSLDKFQHLAFKMAENSIKLQSSRLMVRHAARLYDQGSQETTMYSAMAKRQATQSCFEIANSAIQMHGGYGYLNDYPVERVMRDLRVHNILEGTSQIMMLIISRNIFKD